MFFCKCFEYWWLHISKIWIALGCHFCGARGCLSVTLTQAAVKSRGFFSRLLTTGIFFLYSNVPRFCSWTTVQSRILFTWFLPVGCSYLYISSQELTGFFVILLNRWILSSASTMSPSKVSCVVWICPLVFHWLKFWEMQFPLHV